MPLWGNIDRANNSPVFGAQLISAGSGNANVAANTTALFNNVTSSAFVDKQAVGVFGADATEVGIAGEGTGIAHAGWQLRKRGTGPLASVAVTAAGSGFSNGETVTVTATGATNATLTLTANATGNLTAAEITDAGGGFLSNAALTFTYNREKHLGSITVGGTPTGYSNSDVIQVGNGTINATASISTNSTGGFVTANVTIVTPGLWAAAKANTNVQFSVANSSGGASAGSGATFAAGLANSTGGTITAILGGRAGRVQYETLVAFSSLTSDASDDTQLPDS